MMEQNGSVFCKITAQSYTFTAHIDRKLRVYIMENLTFKEVPKQRAIKCCPVHLVCLNTERVS